MRKRGLASRRSEGQSVVLMALALVVLLGLSGLAVDGANAFAQRRQASNTADAAAMAGTSILAEIRRDGGSPSEINSAITGIIADHGLAGADNLTVSATYVTIDGTALSAVTNAGTIPATARGVRVDLGYRFNTFLMPVLGQETLPATADATAVYGPLGTPPFGGDIMPVTVSYGSMLDMQDNPDDIAVFGTDTGAYKGMPGAFGGVNLVPNTQIPNGNGSPADCTNGPVDDPDSAPDTPRYWWCNGTNHDIEAGDWLYSNPGMVANNLASEIQYRLENRPVGLVPIFDTITGSGANAQYRIVGFMAIELTGYQLTGNPNNRHISAKFVDFFVTTGGINPNAAAFDTGVYAINLID